MLSNNGEIYLLSCDFTLFVTQPVHYVLQLWLWYRIPSVPHGTHL